MKNIWITYCLFADRSQPADDFPHKTELVESCIKVAFPEELANDVLEKQSESEYVKKSAKEGLYDWLNMLARLQGYQEGHFVSAETAE